VIHDDHGDGGDYGRYDVGLGDGGDCSRVRISHDDFDLGDWPWL
jgi:hypothetical protein